MGCKVTVHPLFQGAMPSFHHGGLTIPIRRKMMRPLFLEPHLHPFIVKFFALIRLHAERPPRRGLFINAFQSSYHVLAAFRFDGDGPGILGQDIDHGQQIGNLRTTTKFTTTTSVDRERTGRRTSVSAGKRKLKMQSIGRSTTTTLNVNKQVEVVEL